MKYMIEQYLAGRSLESLAREFGVSKSTIANDLRLAGVKRRPRGRPKKQGRASATRLNAEDEATLVAVD
jgi:transposase-like protein